MQKRIPIKNHQYEIQLIAQRSMVGLIFVFILISLLIARLGYLQLYMHHVYNTLSTKNWLDLVPVEPTRGLIYDRNGILLADNTPVFSLDVIPFRVKDMTNSLVALRKLVSIDDNELQQFQRQLRQHRRFDEIPLKFRLSDQEVARFTENQHQFPGFSIKARLMRRYPYGASFSHVLGYVGRINSQELNQIDQINYSASHYIGKLGIEKYYEEELHGKVGYSQVENDASGKPIRILKEIDGVPGKNIYLTIDSNLQFQAEKALGDKRGAVVAIDPATGQVLALVSKPGYDPNQFVLGISQNDFQALQQSEDKPLFNRALRGLYPLASTIKPYLALEGLNSGLMNSEETILDPGWFQIRSTSHQYHDYIPFGHGNINLTKALISSCDVYFYQLANKIGIKRMDAILSQFGFGSLTGIDLDDELPGVVASPDWKRKTKNQNWYEGDTILSGIGQGYMLATPLQLAAATAALANRGQRYIPYLLLGQQTPGEPYHTQQPIPLESIALSNDQYWNIVIKAMQQVVSSQQGTAHRYFGKNYTYSVAAKTGTGQLVARRGSPNEVDTQSDLPEKLRDHHLVIVFAPVDKPKIALAIITENSNAPVQTARKILDYYLGSKQHVYRNVETKVQKIGA